VLVTIGVATLLAIIALLLLPPHANGNFVYWTLISGVASPFLRRPAPRTRSRSTRSPATRSVRP
jgi:hypothetical protein